MSHLVSRISRRRMLSVATALMFAMATTSMPAFAAKPPKAQPPANMIPLVIEDVVIDPVTGQLFAVGTLGDQSFMSPITLSASPNAADPTCPILHLELGPIFLNLLGLVVETSEICLDITAHPGEGLLGDLLCAVANLLNGGTVPLAAILNGLLEQGVLGDFLGGLTDLLNGALGVATAGNALAAAECNILNLAVGPLDLTLLGLQVELDDCNNGPVTVDITAVPGPGNLLGNLLCGLAGLLDAPNPNANAIARALNRIAAAIEALL